MPANRVQRTLLQRGVQKLIRITITSNQQPATSKMSGTGYQVENVLSEFWRQRMPGFGNPDDRLRVSEEGFQLGRERGNGRHTPPSGWAQPANILDRIADNSELGPEVEYEQQRRFGRFLVPAILPPLPEATPFPRVQDHVGTYRKSIEVPEEEAVVAEAATAPSATPELAPPAAATEDSLEIMLEPDLPLGADDSLGLDLLTPEIEIPELSAADAMFADERKEPASEETAAAAKLEPEAEEATPATEVEAEGAGDAPASGEAVESAETAEVAEVEAEAEAAEVAEEEPEPVVAAPSTAALLDAVDDEEIDDDDDFEEGLKDTPTDEADVVFGTAQVTRKSIGTFVEAYPDSALRYLLRRNLDGRPLPSEFEAVHEQWTDRGLSRGRLKRHLLDLMKWDDIPDLPIHELLGEVRGRLFAFQQ